MAQSRKDKQGDGAASPRRNRIEPVARESEPAAVSAFIRKGFSDPVLVLRWREIAGPEVARLAVPVRLSEDTKGGTLTLKAEPGASVFLQHETRALCDRINAYLGRQAVEKLRFVQGPLVHRPQRQPALTQAGAVGDKDPALRFEGDKTLREALLALARWRQTPKD